MENELGKNTETKPAEEPKKREAETEPTAEELKAQIKKLETENGKLRQANTAASADASKWKKQYQEANDKYNNTLSAEEQKKIQHDEELAALRDERDRLRTERNVANYKAELTSMGFEDGLAAEVAQAVNDGNSTGLFDGLRRFIAAHDKALKENAFRTNPTLQGGSSQKAYTKEQFDAMGYTDRVKVYQEYPELYKEFTK